MWWIVRYFDHFIKLFNRSNNYSIPKKIACITDRDPSRKSKNGGRNFEKCYPYEFNHDTANYDYVENAQSSINKFGTDSNIRFFSQNIDKGKTFEYDLELLITESMKNQQEIKELMQSNLGDAVSKLRASGENERIIQSLEATQWSDVEKKKALIASRYLNSIGKGENSLELCDCLEENLLKPEAEKKEFIVPQYIKDAIEWLIQ